MFSLFGSADGVVNMLVPALQALLVRGVLPAAVSLGATLLDEGTETGLVKLLRPALAARHPDALRVMGVVRQCTCAARLLDLWLVLLLVCAALRVSLTVCVCCCGVAVAGGTNLNGALNSHMPFVEANHSGVVITPTKTRGSEGTTAACMLTALAHNLPAIAVLASGNSFTKTMVSRLCVYMCVQRGVRDVTTVCACADCRMCAVGDPDCCCHRLRQARG